MPQCKSESNVHKTSLGVTIVIHVILEYYYYLITWVSGQCKCFNLIMMIKYYFVTCSQHDIRVAIIINTAIALGLWKGEV